MNEEENKVVEAVEETPQQVEKTTPAVEEKPDDGVIRVDLRNFNQEQEDAVPEQETNASDDTVGEPEDKESSEAVVEEVREPNEEEQPVQNEDQPVLEEITEEEVQEQTADLADEVKEAIADQQESGIELPENIQKVVDFINDTGGSLEDYVRLNQDYSQLAENQLLVEYYKQSKPHLTDDEISFLIEDKFDYDEEIDEERDIKRKKLAFKEELAQAKNHLENQKSKYYEEIKAGSKLTPDQQKAVEFFNRYNKENEEVTRVAEQQKKTFLKRTDEVFTNEFKGFEYNVGDKRYRFNVKDASEVKNTQSDINNFVKKFLDEKNNMKDAKGYHKSLFTAMNADAIANHFYEQGKADALKDSIARSKNVNMDPRKSHEPVKDVKGFKVRTISGDDSSRLKVKIRK
jgi:hypothetical protein